MYIYIYIHIIKIYVIVIFIYIAIYLLFLFIYLCIYVCMYLCMYVCMYLLFIYIYIYTLPGTCCLVGGYLLPPTCCQKKNKNIVQSTVSGSWNWLRKMPLSTVGRGNHCGRIERLGPKRRIRVLFRGVPVGKMRRENVNRHGMRDAARSVLSVPSQNIPVGIVSRGFWPAVLQERQGGKPFTNLYNLQPSWIHDIITWTLVVIEIQGLFSLDISGLCVKFLLNFPCPNISVLCHLLISLGIFGLFL